MIVFRRRRIIRLILLFIVFITVKVIELPQYFVRVTYMKLTGQCSADKNPHKYHCVILVRSSPGRLGNKMFLFASAYGIARLHQCHLYISEVLLNDLNAVFQVKLSSTITAREVYCLERIDTIYTVCRFFPELQRTNMFQYLELKGYWQAHGHFIKYAQELKKQFMFNDNILQTAAGFFRNISQINKICHDGGSSMLCSRSKIQQNILKQDIVSSKTICIGIHVRRQDFIAMKMESSVLYIHQAMNYFRNKHLSPLFIMTSDDKYYCNRFFGKLSDVVITPITFTPSEDLAILSLCQHTILTAGTFGWWAAFLAGGDVLHDNIYPNGDTGTDKQCSKQLYYLPQFLIPVRKVITTSKRQYIFAKAEKVFNISYPSHPENITDYKSEFQRLLHASRQSNILSLEWLYNIF